MVNFRNRNNDSFLQKSKQIDLSDLVGLRAARLLTGKGYTVYDSNEKSKKRIEEILENNQFFNMLFQNEYQMSREAFVALSFRVDNNNEIHIKQSLFDMTIPFYFATNDEGYVNAATTWTFYPGFDTKRFRIMEVWTSKGVTRTLMKKSSSSNSFVKATPKDVMTGGVANTPIPDDLVLEDFWDYSEYYEKTKSIPMFLFTNLPQIGNVGLTGTDYLKSFVSDGHTAKSLQLLMNQTLIQMYKETIINRTRYGLDVLPGESIGEGSDFEEFLEDVILSTGLNKSDNAKTPAIVLQGDPKFESYAFQIGNIKDRYFEACGYSPSSDYDLKTVAGTLYTKTGDVETTRLKKTLREKQLKKFLYLLKEIDSMYGKGNIYNNSDCGITLNANVIYDENTKGQFITLGMDKQLMSRKQAAKILYGINDEEKIEELLTEVDEDIKSNNENEGENVSHETKKRR